MAYSDYGAFVHENGIRRYDKEDVAGFATAEETFGCNSDEIPSGARIWVSLIHKGNKETEWVNSIHHGVMGDGDIRVICHKQGRPEIFEATEKGFVKIQYCDDTVDHYEYAPINFEYKGYKFFFESGNPYYASMKTPDGTFWECQYDYLYGAGFEEER